MSIIEDERRLAGARDPVDLARQRQLEVAPVGQAGERIAARELAEAVDHRLQPGHVAGAAALGQHMARLLQQLQRAVEAERASIAERRVDLGRHEVGVSFGQSSSGVSRRARRRQPGAARVRRMHAMRRVAATRGARRAGLSAARRGKAAAGRSGSRSRAASAGPASGRARSGRAARLRRAAARSPTAAGRCAR